MQDLARPLSDCSNLEQLAAHTETTKRTSADRNSSYETCSSEAHENDGVKRARHCYGAHYKDRTDANGTHPNSQHILNETETARSDQDGCQQDRIKVAIRVRPVLREDKKYYVPYLDADKQICVETSKDDRCVKLHKPLGDTTTKYFDTVFSSSASQESFYTDTTAPLVQKFLDGYNATLLTYGQTGAGKTYSVFGGKGYWESHVKGFLTAKELDLQHPDAGIVPRAIDSIFTYVNGQNYGRCRVYVSFAEIYMEKPKDLLDPEKGAHKKLAIRQKKNGEVYLDGLRCCEVYSPAELMVLVSEGVQTRMSATTRMNTESSRSHAILQVFLEQELPSTAATDSSTIRKSTFNVVDLAGSENVAKSKSTGLRLEEVKLINKSITALGNVISALAERSDRSLGKQGRHIPYRDSILTRLLTDSVGGNSYTLLCANVAPIASHIDESYSTICFATRAMSVSKQIRLNKTARINTEDYRLSGEEIAREAHERFGEKEVTSPEGHTKDCRDPTSYDQQLYRTVELLHGKVEKLNEIIRVQQEEIEGLRQEKQ